MKVLPILICAALLAPGPLAGEVVPFSRQFVVMPPQSDPNVISESYVSATAVDLGAAGFAVGWDLDVNPFTSEDVKGITEGRRVLRGGRPAERFEASTDVFVPGRALGISLAAFGKSGRFVAAWEQLNDLFSGDIWFRRFANGSQPIEHDAVRVTEAIDGRADCNPRVAANESGRFVIVWKRGASFQGGDQGVETTSRILARVFGPDGQPITPEIAVTEPVSDPDPCYYDLKPSVGMDTAGNFVVLGPGKGPLPGIWGRRFSSAGQPLGTPFQITAREGAVELAMAPSGEFAAAWTAPVQRNVTLLGRFAADGTRNGPVVRLPAAYYPLLSMDWSGRVAVFWIEQLGRRHPRTALAVFGPSLERLGPVVYDVPSSRYINAGVAFADDGHILTVWLGPSNNGKLNSVLGRIWRVR